MTRPETRTIGSEQQDRVPEPNVDRAVLGPHGGPLRVLVVGIYYSPDHTGIAPYTTQLCEYLVHRGASVSVFTGVPHYPAWEIDPQYRRRIRAVEKTERLEVRRLRHYVPRKQDALRRAAYELTFGLQVAGQRPTERPDVVLAVIPSLLSAVAAQHIARRAGAPLVVWAQDLMGRAAEQSGIAGGSRVAGAVTAIERRVLRGASRILVLNTRFADYAAAIGVKPGRIVIRPNWAHVEPAPGVSREQTRAWLGWRSDETIVLHTGNMGLKQDLGNVIEAARLADQRGPGTVRFVLMGDGSQRSELLRQAEGAATVELRPPAPSKKYADVLAAADVLLINERPSSVDMSLPSKLTSYLQAGRPVIAASPAAGGTAAEVHRSGGGLVIEPGQPGALLDAVIALTSDPAVGVSMGHRGQAYATEFLSASVALREALAVLTIPCSQTTYKGRLQ